MKTSRQLTFPPHFVFGTATSAHQVEGDQNNDWTDWEEASATCPDASGTACDHYARYPSDIALLAKLGFDAYRFSIEWSRVEPAQGRFSDDALDHYRDVIDVCHDNGIQAAVAFHHFTNPTWFARRGGWECSDAPDLFARFCSVAGDRLGRDIDLAITINEPNMPPLLGYLDGVFPPGKRNARARENVTRNFIRAHELARDALASHTDAPIGLALAMADWHVVDGAHEELHEIRSLREDVFLEAAANDDYIGVNTYTRHRVGREGFMMPEAERELTVMGYEFWPDALAATVRRAAASTRRPVIVTENGIGTNDDERRVAFVTAALTGVHDCIEEGIDIRGYYYWSAFDNFEWNWGYEPRFGLIAVDRMSQERISKPSAAWLGEIARTKTLLPDIMSTARDDQRVRT